MTASTTMKTFSEWSLNLLNNSGFDWISSIPIPLNCTKKLRVSGYLSNISIKASVGPISEKLQELVCGLENSVEITFQEFWISFLCLENISVDSSSIILSLEHEHLMHIVNLSNEPNILKSLLLLLTINWYVLFHFPKNLYGILSFIKISYDIYLRNIWIYT